MEGYITLIGGGSREVIAQLRARRRERAEWAKTLPTHQPGQPFVDAAPRPTPRQEAFEYGDPPLPAYSWPPPRATGWEPR
jgi:hypothetical protein